MSQPPTRREIIHMTLDEYTEQYVSEQDKLRSLPRGWSLKQRARYQRTHFYAPHYQRRQQTRLQQQRQERLQQQRLLRLQPRSLFAEMSSQQQSCRLQEMLSLRLKQQQQPRLPEERDELKSLSSDDSDSHHHMDRPKIDIKVQQQQELKLEPKQELHNGGDELMYAIDEVSRMEAFNDCSTQAIVAEIQEHDMEEDVDSDMLYIPINCTLLPSQLN